MPNELAVNRLNLIFDTIMELDNLLCQTDQFDSVEFLLRRWYDSALKDRDYNDLRLSQARDMLTPDDEFFKIEGPMAELRDRAIAEFRRGECETMESLMDEVPIRELSHITDDEGNHALEVVEDVIPETTLPAPERSEQLRGLGKVLELVVSGDAPDNEWVRIYACIEGNVLNDIHWIRVSDAKILIGDLR